MVLKIDSNIEQPNEDLQNNPENIDDDQPLPGDEKERQRVKTQSQLERERQRLDLNEDDNEVDSRETEEGSAEYGVEQSRQPESEELREEQPESPKTWYQKIGSQMQGWLGGMLEGMKGAGGFLGVAGGWIAKNATAIWNWVSTTAQGVWYGGLSAISNIGLFGVKPFEPLKSTAELGRMRLAMRSKLAQMDSMFKMVTTVGGFSPQLYYQLKQKASEAGKKPGELVDFINMEIEKRFMKYVDHTQKTGETVEVSLQSLTDEALKKLNPEPEPEPEVDEDEDSSADQTEQNETPTEEGEDVLGKTITVAGHEVSVSKEVGPNGAGLVLKINDKKYLLGAIFSAFVAGNLVSVKRMLDGSFHVTYVDLKEVQSTNVIESAEFEKFIKAVAEKGAGTYSVALQGGGTQEVPLTEV